MYIITFYSFKGGVGRTFALVNVAAELTSMGHKVLIVDFDLEAPGLDTFDRLRSPQPHPGVVEYVKEYLSSKQSPDVRDYVYPVEAVAQEGGQLWVMPAGRRDAKYQVALASIDWKRLYHDCQGYWFFEDTKEQWKEALQPDYVLIDSRTGHTDVEGICTRQLPHAVVVLFFPNEQNLVGLKDVCRRIRGEHKQGLKKDIRLHFVMSNVPDLDDEDEVLHHRLEAFHKELGIGKLDAIIHRYESVLLFNQAVFVLDKPQSRLAKEYCMVAEALIRENDADRDGALAFLHDYSRLYLPGVTEGDRLKRILEECSGRNTRLPMDRIPTITDLFWGVPDVLLKIAECRVLEGSFGLALVLFDRAISISGDFAPALLQRALCKHRLGDVSGSADDLLRYLQISGIHQLDVLRALRELATISPSTFLKAIKLSSVNDLDLRSKLQVAKFLASGPTGQELAIEYLRGLVSKHDMKDLRLHGELLGLLSRCLIESRRWQDAFSLIEKEIHEVNLLWEMCGWLSLPYMIASWGLAGLPKEDACRWWLEHTENEQAKIVANTGGNSPPMDAHSHQVNALASWRLGDIPRAQQEIEAAIKWMDRHGRDSFSCWRYREAPPLEFRKDCEQIRRMIQGEPIRPTFLGEPAPANEPGADSVPRVVES